MGFEEIIKEHRDRLKSFLDKLTNDSHIPVALLIFAVTSAYHFHTGKDLGTNYTNSLYALYGFLGGHALVYQKWPDPTTGPTVNVDVNNNNANSATANAAPPAAPPDAPADPSKG